MSTAEIGRQLDDLGGAIDDLLGPEPPVLLGLGEPTHGVAAFPMLRNELLPALVERGYRSIALEVDHFAASVVDDYVAGGTADVNEVLETGFSHRFGAVPGNRELVEWLRAHNAEREPQDRVRFRGFDGPMEISGAPSPRRALTSVIDYLSVDLDVDGLLGADADWSSEAAMFDPAASIGGSDRARALRVIADDLASALRRAAPGLCRRDPDAHDRATAHARTALGLLRYHAAMASSSTDRIATLLSLRAEMMADNLLAIVAREQHRGPTLVFAHNAHLQRAPSDMAVRRGRGELGRRGGARLPGLG
ncbi:erythromycin esterase family protein [Saccharopolyspora sp. NPDC000359]|uniref:erythromycin esterase family protein n=1 Tax=Saccharopolyspora sp. NPDC000359 TaxID=3154251 RepID=UPI003319701C